MIDRVPEIYNRFGISSILVVGSSGSDFHKAGCVLQMDQYLPKEITALAKEPAKRYPLSEEPAPAGEGSNFRRLPKANSTIRNSDRIKVRSSGMDCVSLEKQVIDLRLVEQLADPEQLAALGYLLLSAEKHLFDGTRPLQSVIEQLWDVTHEKGIAAVCEGRYLPCNLAMPRIQEIFACINRYWGLHL